MGDGIELEPLKRLVIERTEGNPFFIEEMVQALFDEGALVRNGVVKADALALAITSAADGAGNAGRAYRPACRPEQKDLLQMLAVIGRESPLGLVRQVASQADAQLERMLAELAGGRVHLRAAGASRCSSIPSSTR